VVLGLIGKKSSSLLGVDIGSASVKLLELSRSDQGFRVEAYAVEALPSGAVIEQRIVELEVVGAALSRALIKSTSTLRRAAAAVAGSAVISKRIEMPADLDDDALESQVRVEAAQYVPYPLEDVALDFAVQGPFPGNPQRVEVLLAACRIEHVEAREAVLGLAGLTARLVDIETLALERSCHLLLQSLPGAAELRTLGVLDICASTTTLSVLRHGRVIYSREQVTGGFQRTQSALEVVPQGPLLASFPGDCSQAVLQPYEAELLQQASRALQLFAESLESHPLDCLLLAGDSAVLQGLAPLVEVQLGVQVRVADPFVGMSMGGRVDAEALQRDASGLLIACGLALRGFD
jgi:type IV pilus assembly protein PilM